MKPPVEAPTSSARRPSTVDAAGVERVGELDAAARDERGALVDRHQLLDVDHLARLLRAPPARPTRTSPGHHRGGRPGPRREQAALGQQCVQAPLAHRRRTLAHGALRAGTALQRAGAGTARLARSRDLVSRLGEEPPQPHGCVRARSRPTRKRTREPDPGSNQCNRPDRSGMSRAGVTGKRPGHGTASGERYQVLPRAAAEGFSCDPSAITHPAAGTSAASPTTLRLWFFAMPRARALAARVSARRSCASWRGLRVRVAMPNKLRDQLLTDDGGPLSATRGRRGSVAASRAAQRQPPRHQARHGAHGRVAPRGVLEDVRVAVERGGRITAPVLPSRRGRQLRQQVVERRPESNVFTDDADGRRPRPTSTRPRARS